MPLFASVNRKEKGLIVKKTYIFVQILKIDAAFIAKDSNRHGIFKGIDFSKPVFVKVINKNLFLVGIYHPVFLDSCRQIFVKLDNHILAFSRRGENLKYKVRGSVHTSLNNHAFITGNEDVGLNAGLIVLVKLYT